MILGHGSGQNGRTSSGMLSPGVNREYWKPEVMNKLLYGHYWIRKYYCYPSMLSIVKLLILCSLPWLRSCLHWDRKRIPKVSFFVHKCGHQSRLKQYLDFGAGCEYDIHLSPPLVPLSSKICKNCNQLGRVFISSSSEGKSFKEIISAGTEKSSKHGAWLHRLTFPLSKVLPATCLKSEAF